MLILFIPTLKYKMGEHLNRKTKSFTKQMRTLRVFTTVMNSLLFGLLLFIKSPKSLVSISEMEDFYLDVRNFHLLEFRRFKLTRTGVQKFTVIYTKYKSIRT